MTISGNLLPALMLGCITMAATAAEESAVPSGTQTVTENGVTYTLKPLTAPFKLTDEEQAEVTKVLEQWEQHSAKFDNYSCKFTCWIYDTPWQREVTCNGEFRIDKTGQWSISHGDFRWTKEKQKLQQLPQSNRLVFNGQTLIISHESDKVVSRTPVPQNPKRVIRIPFVLQASAKELAEQYYIRISKHDKDRHQIRLQFYPRTKATAGWFDMFASMYISSQSDWRRYNHVELILSDETYMPLAMQLHESQNSRTSYLAHNPEINTEDTSDWFEVETPEGWQETKLPHYAEEKIIAGDDR